MPQLTMRAFPPTGTKFRIEAAKVGSAVRREMSAIGRETKTELQRYPPQLPGTRYRRTGNLKRGWSVRVQSDGHIRIHNEVRYSGRVQGYSEIPTDPRQLFEFIRRNWTPIDRASREVFDRHKQALRKALQEVR